MGLAAFMATPLGRLIRVVAGIALGGLGLTLLASTSGWVGVTIGVVFAGTGVAFIVFGILNVCVIAVLLGAPFSGREVLRRQQQAPS